MFHCRTCGKPIDFENPLVPLAPTSKRCHKCVLKKLARRHLGGTHHWGPLRAMFVRQHGKCAYTGERLVLGENASLDHRHPKSRGGARDLGNLQWVLAAVNDMKCDRTHAEFVELCRKVTLAQDHARPTAGERGPA